jgi:hypothetical protein
MADPVIIRRKAPDHRTGQMLPDPDPSSHRAYVGGNNHHIEYRVREVKKGKATVSEWTGNVVTAFEAAQRKLARLSAFKAAGVPKPDVFRDAKLPKAQRAELRRRWGPIIAAIEAEHPIVDRRDNEDLGGKFVMSLAEGEMVRMMSKASDGEKSERGYFVVAKIDKPRSVVLVPHWDARSATERKDASNQKVPHSSRDSFAVTPSDLLKLACEDDPHAVKVRVSALGKVTVLQRD